MIPALELTSGDKLPVVGLGMWKIDMPAVAGTIDAALEAGYRHFDCACDYGNEAEVGAALEAAMKRGIGRSDLWITTKLWNTYHDPQHVRPALEKQLRDLRLDYLDLYLVHFPIAQAFVPFEKRYPPGWFYDPAKPQDGMKLATVPLADTWAAMEDLHRAGLVRNIGISNYNIPLIRETLAVAKIRPSVLQVELHPRLAQEKLLRYCRQERIAVTGYSPLGAISYVPLGMAKQEDNLLDLEPIRAAAKHHGRSPGQIVLRWGVQRGTAIIPKTSRRERLKENISLFDFELSAAEMAAIAALDRHQRFNDPGVFCEAAFKTFFPIYD